MQKLGRHCGGSRFTVIVWGAALLWGAMPGLAVGQQPVEPQELLGDLDERVPYASGHTWTRVGLDEDVAHLTVAPSGVVLALTEKGAIWRWGGESSWRLVLGKPGARLDDPDAIDEEDLLLEAETLLGESTDFGTQDRPRSVDESDPDAETGEPRGLDRGDPGLGAEDAADLALQDQLPRRTTLRAGQTLWAASAVSGLVLCDRSDGTWRSDDDGLTWDRVLDLPRTHAFTDLPGTPGGVLAGTVEGLRTSLDRGRSWMEVDDPLSGISVYAFTSDTERLWVGTEEGLFVSSSVVGWAKMVPRRDADMPVWALANDPYWRGGLWLAGPVGILRTDDGGESTRPAGRNPLMGTRTLVALEVAGHVLAAGADGVWESLDGGIQWRPLARGLSHPRVQTMAMSGRGVLVGGPDGAFLLQRAEPSSEEDLVRMSQAHQAEPPMGELVEVALRRPGLRLANVLTHRTLMASMVLPKLTLTGRLDRFRYITADHEARSNDGGLHKSWFVGAVACFGNCSSSVAFSDTDVVALAEEYGVDVRGLPELAVVGDEVYVADSAGALAPAAANVAERLTQYRSEVASRVSELALSRRRLVQARSDVQGLSLKDQAAHELRIQESAARIDVYTNGYFTRVLEAH